MSGTARPRRRCHLDRPLAAGDLVELDERAAHHLLRVLRLREGERVALFNGDGREYHGTLRRRGRGGVVELDGVYEEPPAPRALELAQAVVRSERMDLALQKAVELGVTRIRPLYAERGLGPFDAARLAAKRRHWQGVIVAACEQSGRCRLPELAEPQSLAEALAAGGGLRLWLDPQAERGLDPAELTAAGRIAVFVGPEGGFSDEETRAARAAGCTAVRLGRHILRTETAGPAALAAVQALAGDWR